MLGNERAEPTFLDKIENSDTPLEAVAAVGELSLRRIVAFPLKLGSDILTIVMNGDGGEMVREASNRLP